MESPLNANPCLTSISSSSETICHSPPIPKLLQVGGDGGGLREVGHLPVPETDRAAGLGGGIEQGAEGGEHPLQVLVVSRDLALEGVELGGEFGVGTGEVAEAD